MSFTEARKVRFPSLEFFQALQECMVKEQERFKKLGYIDTTFGIRIKGGSFFPGERRYLLSFEVFECREVKETADFDSHSLDFILEGPWAVWRQMIENIKTHGQADAFHSINTLTHLGEKLRVVYTDPDGHDKLYRFNESIQEFFDLASKLEIDFRDDTTASPG